MSKHAAPAATAAPPVATTTTAPTLEVPLRARRTFASAAGSPASYGAPPALPRPRGGSPLSSAVRHRFEPLLGVPLDRIRIHDDAAAHAATAAVDAAAFTYGSDVYLGPGLTDHDRDHVLAHELVHAAAQGDHRDEPALSVGATTDRAEVETDRAAAQLLWGRPARVPIDRDLVIRRLPPGRNGEPLVLRATGFADAAGQFIAILDEVGEHRSARIVVVGATNLAVFSRTGEGLGTFRLRAPLVAATGVHVRVDGAALHPLVRSGATYAPASTRSAGNIDFSRDLENQAGFDALFSGGMVAFYVIPAAAGTPPPPAPPPSEPDPLMAFTATGSANAPPWPGAVIPLTPQITGAHTTGSFLMRLENNQGYTTLERVTNLMQPINYRWEVLKLDEHFMPMAGERRTATRWDAARSHFERRERDLDADRRTMLGEHPERQSLPESVIRSEIADAVHERRWALAMAGEVAMTVVRVITDRPDNPFSEDIIDIPWREPGDYFVRCFATPVSDPDAPIRRGTTVHGASVSVFDMATFAGDVLGTDASDATRARTRTEAIDAELAAPADESDTSPAAVARRARTRAFLPFERAYLQSIITAAGDRTAILAAELAYVRARIAWLASDAAVSSDAAVTETHSQMLRELRSEETRLAGVIERSTSRLGAGVAHTATMRALLVDESSGTRTPLEFSIGERQYIVRDQVEVVIADVTAADSGRVFSGRGDGVLGAGRPGALRAAMRDLRENLHRGRGYLAYRVPPSYAAIDLDLPNPMQLQMSAADQVVEMVDDAAHVATLAALVAAPFTDGASLSILAVLAPVQAATSLYRIVNRSMYGDLHLDSQAISDFINIASLGIGRIGSASRVATRGVQIVTAGRNVALLLLDAGNYIVMAWDFFRALTAPDTSADPREGRRRRLLALLTALEGAAIPVAGHLWPDGARPTATPDAEPRPTGDAEPRPTGDAEPRPTGDAEPRPSGVDPRSPADRGGPTRVEPPPRDAAPPAEPTAHPERTARPDPDALTDHPTLRRGLPADLAGALRITVDPSLPEHSVRVEYVVENGLVTDISLRVGERATWRNVAEHVGTVRGMQRYQGFSGRVRTWLDRVHGWFTLNPTAPVGSRAWEARLELAKLPPIIEARVREYAHPDTPAERRAELLEELATLNDQLAEHAATVAAMADDPGRGYVAAEGSLTGRAVAAERGYPRLPDPTATAADGTPLGDYIWRFRMGELEVYNRGDGPKLVYDPATRQFRPDDGAPSPPHTFAEHATRADAYEFLGGNDPTSPFGQYTSMLIREGLVRDHAEIVRMLQEPGGVTDRTVRSNVKDLLVGRVIEHLRSPARLAATPLYMVLRRQGHSHADALQAASHAEMVRLTRSLYPSDRGAIAERWYGEFAGNPDAPTQIVVSPADAARLGVTIPDTLRIDRIDGSFIYELKNVQDALGTRDRAAIDQQLALVGQRLELPGGRRSDPIEFVAVALLDPAGALANASYFFGRLAPGQPNADHLLVQLHSANGQTMLVGTGARGILADRARLETFLRTGRIDP